MPMGKKRWTVMPMKALNAYANFMAMMTKLHIKWNLKMRQQGLSNAISRVIVDDVTLAEKIIETLLKFAEIVFKMLQHYRAAI